MKRATAHQILTRSKKTTKANNNNNNSDPNETKRKEKRYQTVKKYDFITIYRFLLPVRYYMCTLWLSDVIAFIQFQSNNIEVRTNKNTIKFTCKMTLQNVNGKTHMFVSSMCQMENIFYENQTQ